MKTIRILFIGDVVGSTGLAMFQKHIDRIIAEHNIDAVIVNGENSGSSGRGITSRVYSFFKHNAVNVVTTGNHIWHKKDIYHFLNQTDDLLRPANYPPGAPGKGIATFDINGITVGVINLQGRVFMRDHVDCPFRAAESILTYLKSKTDIILIDFHAEATSEKMAMGHIFDGRVSAVVGTHTHVQTADDRILPGGTAFMTDLGLVGSLNSMLGMKKDPIIQNFLTQMPVKFKVDTSMPVVMCGAWIEIDTKTGKALDIQRIRIVDGELNVNEDDE